MLAIKQLELRRATIDDAFALKHFLDYELHIHRHLDWREPKDWLGRQPFWLLCRGEKILAALACPADPPGVAWVRLFCSAASINRFEAWSLLFEKARIDLLEQDPSCIIAAVSLRDWFTRILVESGCRHHSDIVILERDQPYFQHETNNSSVNLRDMRPSDLHEVETIDHLAFSPLWHIPYDGLMQAYNQSTHSMIAELDNQIVGFQISTSNPFGAHLARLAVRPEMRRKSIGKILVGDLVDFYLQNGIDRITVNTQKDNIASISLYRRMDFALSNESFPVFLFDQHKSRI